MAKPVKSALCKTETMTKPQKAGCLSTRRALLGAAGPGVAETPEGARAGSLGMTRKWIAPQTARLITASATSASRQPSASISA
jgi:hypothetical protein